MSRAPGAPGIPRTLAAACALLLCVVAASRASEWGPFVEASDRSLDPAIIEAFQAGDFDTQIEICAAMGKRSDPLAAGLLAALLAGFSRQDAYRSEHLLRVLLESLFDPRHGEAGLRERFEANRGELLAAQSRWGSFADAQLKGALLRILPFLESSFSLPLLMAAGKSLVESLEASDGLLPPDMTGLVLDFLGTAQRISTPDFLDPCLEMARLSREKVVIDKARLVVAGIRAGMR
jgi:hypothetical protein